MPRRRIIKDFAAWTTLSSLRSGAPIKSRHDIYPLIEVPDFQSILDGSRIIEESEFSEWHESAIAALGEHESRLVVGWSAKIINVYLKTAAYVGELGRPGLRSVLHPPIDGGLWKGINRKFKLMPEITADTHCVTRIKEITSYETYRQIIQGCRKAAGVLGCLLIEVEQLWEGATHEGGEQRSERDRRQAAATRFAR